MLQGVIHSVVEADNASKHCPEVKIMIHRKNRGYLRSFVTLSGQDEGHVVYSPHEYAESSVNENFCTTLHYTVCHDSGRFSIQLASRNILQSFQSQPEQMI